MGKSKNFVNMTGAPTLSQVEQGILLLLRNSNVQYIYNVKIDSISMLEKNVKFSIDAFRSNSKYLVKSHPTFKGITLKHRKKGISMNYFEASGKAVYMGLRCPLDIKEFHDV